MLNCQRWVVVARSQVHVLNIVHAVVNLAEIVDVVVRDGKNIVGCSMV